MVRDFMRSATAMTAGVEEVDGVMDKDSGLVETRVEASFLSSRECLPREVEGANP
jgi:hypothetical protein